jgi:serine/threonine protein kinase/WD40 repeat protein
MSRPSLRRVEKLFHQAVDLDPAQRSSFLQAQCAGDEQLRIAVEELLRHDRTCSEEFLVSPIAGERPPASLDTQPNDLAETPEPSGTPALAGDSIAGYEILKELGRGGMGVVYKARQKSLNRLVALKMLRGPSSADPQQRARFRQEAETLARLQHPNVVQIYEVGEHADQPYFAMEYVAGATLAQRVRGAPQSPPVAAQFMELLARATHVVHQYGVIHRDLKPANILLVPGEGQRHEDFRTGHHPTPLTSFLPKITDFGVAKDVGAGRDRTRTGQTMGTPNYMAPEQFRGAKTLGPWADIYALGVILYELLTGRPPFDEATPAETIARVLFDEPVPPARLQNRVPRDLETICLKCLEKEPRRRYATAQDLAEDLRRFREGRPIQARPLGPVGRLGRWARRRPLVACLLGLTTFLAVFLFGYMLVSGDRLQTANVRLQEALTRSKGQAEEERRQLVHLCITIGMRHLEEEDSLTALPWLTEALRLDQGHPDEERKHRVRLATTLRKCPRLVRLLVAAPGQRLLCVRLGLRGCWTATADSDHVVRVWDVMTGTPAGPACKPGREVTIASLTPNGRLLALAMNDGSVRLWDVTSGQPRTLPLPQGGPVDQMVVTEGGEELLTRRADGRVLHWAQILGSHPVKSGLGTGPLEYSTISADGRWVITSGRAHGGSFWDVERGTSPMAVPNPGFPVGQAIIGPGGRRLALVGKDFTVRVFDIPTAKWIGVPMRHGGEVKHVALSPVGDRVVTVARDSQVGVWDLTTGAVWLPAVGYHATIRHVEFSLDGERLVTAGDDNRARVWDIAQRILITAPLRHNGSVNLAAFRSDGKQVLTSALDGTVRLWDLSSVKPPRVRRVKAFPGPPKGPPDRRITISSNRQMAQVVNAAGLPISPPLWHTSNILHAGFNQDGRLVLTTSDDNTARLWEVATGKLLLPPFLHQGPVTYANFSPDGHCIATASLDRTARVWDVSTGEPLTSPLRHPGPVVWAQISPEGRLWTCTGDRVMRSFDLGPDERPAWSLARLARVLAGGRIDPKAGLIALNQEQLNAEWTELRQDRAISSGR